jgi:hypothetical protein
MNDQQFAEISTKLDSIIKLLAIGSVHGKQLKQQVALLHSLGLQPKQIADMLDKKPNHIRVIIHELKKETEAVEEGDKDV